MEVINAEAAFDKVLKQAAEKQSSDATPKDKAAPPPQPQPQSGASPGS